MANTVHGGNKGCSHVLSQLCASSRIWDQPVGSGITCGPWDQPVASGISLWHLGSPVGLGISLCLRGLAQTITEGPQGGPALSQTLCPEDVPCAGTEVDALWRIKERLPKSSACPGATWGAQAGLQSKIGFNWFRS